MSRIGDKIRVARINAKFSEKQLGKKLGVSEKFIKEVETGKRILNENLMSKLSKVLGKDINDITMSFEAQAFEEQREEIKPKIKPEKVKDVWSDAFGSILKSVPIYDYNMKIIGTRQLPVISNKIEGHTHDKVLYLKIEDDDMMGFRISKGDLTFGFLTHEIFNNSICLIDKGSERVVRQIKRLDNSKVLLVSNRGAVKTETASVKDIKVLAKLEKVEIKL